MNKWFSKKRIISLSILLVIIFLLLRSCGDDEEISNDATFSVKRGALTISVSESGTINYRNQIIIKNEVEGRTTILYLIPEGTQVKKGDLLVELDASPLQDQLVDQQIKVENAEAVFVRARENLDVVKSEATSEVDKADLALQFAKQDLQKYIEGEYPNELSKAESEITVAREELSRAAERLKWSQILYKENYLSQSELQADELAEKKARLTIDQAIAAKELLTEFTHKKKLAELESNVKQNTMALERIKKKAAADVIQAEAELKAKDTEFQREKTKLEKLNKQITRTKIYAPKDGLVVYPTSGKSFFSFSEDPFQEGKEVREREELIYLPAADSVLATVKLNESLLQKVKIGLPVRITVSAMPGQFFTGKVHSIAPLPDPSASFLGTDIKVFNTEIYIDKTKASLRTGMTCEVEIIVAHYEDALYVPVQAVTRLKGKPVVYVRSGSSFKPRDVQVGLDNNSMVHILSGVKEGEEVWLTPPIETETFSESQPQGLDDQLQKTLEDANKQNIPAFDPSKMKLPKDFNKIMDQLKDKLGDELPEDAKDIDIEEIMKQFPDMPEGDGQGGPPTEAPTPTPDNP